MTEKKYQCLVVDDEPLGRELIEAHLGQLPRFELVASCASAIEASHYLNQYSVDLMFLDIEMPLLKGTDFYQGLSHKPEVIFTTAYRDYAVEGFELEAVDYLLKPIVFARFFKAIERFLALQNNVRSDPGEQETSAPRHIFVRKDRKEVKLVLADILYIQALKDYITIHTQSASYTIKSTVAAFSSRLSSDFIRVHRSYVVNRRHITAFTKYDIEIDQIEIPIGDKYKQAVIDLLHSD